VKTEDQDALRLRLAGLFHDMNNLACTMVGNTDLSRRCLPEDHPAEPWLRDAVDAGARLRNLLMQGVDLLAASNPAPEAIDVGVTVHAMMPLLRSMASGQVTIQAELVGSLQVQLPRGQFDRVVLNLVTNALRAVEDTGGTVGIAAEDVDLGAPLPTRFRVLPAGKYLRFWVEDTGHGIEPELLLHIFETGFTRSADEGGRGLGLAVVRDLVQEWKGGVEVESQVGKGSRFTVWVPVA